MITHPISLKNVVPGLSVDPLHYGKNLKILMLLSARDEYLSSSHYTDLVKLQNTIMAGDFNES